MADWYEHPAYYEAVFGPGSGRELDFLEAVNARHGLGGDTWLEPACGAGRLVALAARRGYRVVGYDPSKPMLAYARRRFPRGARGRVHLYEGRMESFTSARWKGRIDLAFNLVSTFRYLESDAAALAHLRRTRVLLRPGGLYVLGFHLTDYARQHVEHERWVGHSRGARIVSNTREWPPDRRLRRSRMRSRLRIERPGSAVEMITTEWFFRTYSQSQAERLIDRAGLRRVADYDFDYDLEHPWPGMGERLDRVMVLARRE